MLHGFSTGFFTDPGFLLVLALALGVLLILYLRRTPPDRGVTQEDKPAPPQEPEEQWQRILFDNAPAAYLEIDRQGVIRRANKTACSLFDQAVGELCGRHCAELIPDVEREKFRAEIGRKLAGEVECVPYERKYQRRDGTLLTLEVRETLLFAGGREIGMLWAAVDATERHEKQEEAEQSTSELKALFEALPDLFIRVNSTGKILDFEAGPSTSGFTASATHIGKRLSAVLPGDGGEKLERTVTQVLESRSLAVIEYSAPAERDREYFEARVVPLHWDQVIVIVRNISERKRAEERLEQFAQEVQWKNEELAAALVSAREATESKNRFLANMGYEIHTPMSGVMGMLDLLLNSRLEPEQRECAESVRSCANSLLQLLNNVLDLSRIGSGSLKLDAAPVDLPSTIRHVADMYASQAHVKGLESSMCIAPELSAPVRGDAGRLRQILANLLANAVKFTEQGSIRLRAEQAGETEDKVVLRCTVEDTGRGMTQAEQDKVLQILSSRETVARSAEGGLGLAISRQLVDLLGGQIGFSSAPGRGTSFWFTAVFEKRESRHIPAAPLHGSRVMLVAAPGSGTSLLRQSLESWGCHCKEVSTPALVVPELRSAAEKGHSMAVAILDGDLPGINLVETGRAIAGDLLTRGTTVVALLSSLRDDQADLRDAQLYAHLNKPVLPSQLYELLLDVLRLHPQTPREAPVKGRAGRPRILLADDNEVNQRITVHYLAAIGLETDVVATGRQAVAAAEQNAYDLILMDCLMPEMDGFEATGQIRRHEGAARHTPICALTALTMDGSRERCIAAGMDDYISKPFSAAELQNVVHKLIGYTAAR